MSLTIAFTSGCFDCLHEGHRHLLWRMNGLADLVHVAVNSDDFIRRRKHREPINTAQERMDALRRTGLVDELSCFDEDGPLALILRIRPNFIVVGDDYALEQIVGCVECHSGEWPCKVVRVPRLPDFSTSRILKERQMQQIRNGNPIARFHVPVHSGNRDYLQRSADGIGDNERVDG